MGPKKFTPSELPRAMEAIQADILTHGYAYVVVWRMRDTTVLLVFPPAEIDAIKDGFNEEVSYRWRTPEEWKGKQMDDLPTPLQDAVLSRKNFEFNKKSLWVLGRAPGV